MAQQMRQYAIEKNEPLELHLVNGMPYTSFIDSVYADARLVAQLPLSRAKFTRITFYGYANYYWYPHVVPRVQLRTL